jgi:hypothetical protein
MTFVDTDSVAIQPFLHDFTRSFLVQVQCNKYIPFATVRAQGNTLKLSVNIPY